MDTLQCTMTLNEHNDVATSLICWDEFLRQVHLMEQLRSGHAWKKEL